MALLWQHFSSVSPGIRVTAAVSLGPNIWQKTRGVEFRLALMTRKCHVACNLQSSTLDDTRMPLGTRTHYATANKAYIPNNGVGVCLQGTWLGSGWFSVRCGQTVEGVLVVGGGLGWCQETETLNIHMGPCNELGTHSGVHPPFTNQQLE